MLSFFGRQRQGEPAAGDATQEESLKSHVLPRFVKRIRGTERPTVLDLGRLSGGNIEFFGRIGCRLQIEDLLARLEEESHPPTSASRSSEPADSGASRSESVPPLRPAPRTMPFIREARVAPPQPAGATGRPAMTTTRPGTTTDRPETATARPGTATSQPGATAARPGRRPTRHIVLPPRTFHRAGDGVPAAGSAYSSGAGSWKSPLPTRFSFDDESFDAIVAWDVVDFYDPESARRVAAEVRRILKPGGLVLAFFHAKRATAPVRPRRYRIVDEGRFQREVTAFAPMPRQVYQNRDIEKMFTGLRIIEQYYLKTGLREILMEKRSAPPEIRRAGRVTARPKPRFRIE